jgi:uncharacterized protein (TIGR02246 family)
MRLHSLLLVVAGAFPEAQADQDTAKEVQNAVRTVQAAFDRGDKDLLRRYLTPDHASILPYARITSTEDLLKHLSDFKFAEYKIEDLQVKLLTPDVALVSQRATIQGTYRGRKVPSPVHVTTVWVRRGGQWLQDLYQETPPDSK